MIEKIIVHDVGPLHGFEVNLSQANLIIGRNESGKTTIADLLASKIAENLQGKNPVKEFQKITGINPLRFGGGWKAEIRGSVDIVPAASGGKESLVDIFSLLVIRANKNEVWNKNEEGISSLDYWKSTVKNMLAGSDEIAKKIGIIKNYTGTGARIWKIGDVLSSYREILVKKKNEFDSFKKNVSAVSPDPEDAEAIEKLLEELKKTRDAHEYGKRKRLYTRYMEIRSEISSIEERLARYDAAELIKKSSAWENAEKRLKEKSDRVNILKNDIGKIGERKIALSKSMNEKKKRLLDITQLLDGKKSGAHLAAPDNSEREILERQRDEAGKMKKKIPILPVVIIACGLVSFVGMIFWQPAFIVSCTLVLAGIILFYVIKSKMNAHADRIKEKITEKIIEYESKKKASAIAFADGKNDIERIEIELKKLNGLLEDEESQFREAEKLVIGYREEENRLAVEIDAIRMELEAFIAELKDRIYLGGIIQDLKAKKEQLSQKKAEVATLEKEIGKAFKVDSLIPHDLLTRLDREKELVDEKYIEAIYDPKQLDELVKKREGIMKKEHSFDKEFTQMKTNVLKELELLLKKTEDVSSASMKEFYSMFFSEMVQGLAVDSMYDLDAAIGRSETVIEKIALYRKYADFLFQIVSDLEARQETIIRSVFSDKDFKAMVSKLMGYETVETSISGGTVDFRFGTAGYRLDDLSTGAVHQLNLAFRFSLLKKVLAAPSTIILDDAFLHFDHMRRLRACEILRDELIAQGWQFVYTAIDDKAMEKVFTSVFPAEKLNLININEMM